MNYKWTQIEGSDLQLPDSRLTKDRVGLLIHVAGKYRFKLVVSNGQKESEPAFVDVLVEEEKKEEAKEEKK